MTMPRGLKTAGKRVWKAVTEKYELGADELELLLEACRTADDLDAIAKALVNATATVTGARGNVVPHPLFAEARASRLVLAKLLDQLKLPAEDAQPESWTTRRAREAAEARWSGEREHNQRRGSGAA